VVASSTNRPLDFVLTAAELGYALEQYAPAIVIGFANPSQGMTTLDQTTLLSDAEADLRSRGLARAVPGKGVTLEPSLEHCARLLARPHHTWLATLSQEKGLPQLRSIHQARSEFLALEERVDHKWHMAVVPDAQGLATWLGSALQTQTSTGSVSLNLRMATTMLNQILELVLQDQIEQAYQLITNLGLAAPSVERLWPAIHSPTARFTLLVFRNRHTPERAQTRGITVLMTSSDYWVLDSREATPDVVYLSSVDRATVLARIDSLLKAEVDLA